MVGQAIVASWWPGLYYMVFTLQLDSTSPMRRLTETIRTGKAYDQVTAAPDGFFTDLFKCDKSGLMSGDLLYEREYKTLSEANSGHREVLVLLSDGSLKLSPIRSEF
jgi:hypothetical protein